LLTRIKMIARQLRPRLLEMLAESRAVALVGARQVGKSTMLRDLTSSDFPAQMISLDDDAARAAAADDPAGFVASLGAPAAIDEVQRVPDLLLAIKAQLDSDDARGQFLLTGSANILALPTVKDALPGRVDYMTLWPLTAAEVEGGEGNIVDSLLHGEPPQLTGCPIGRAAYAARIARGGYPEAQNRGQRALRSFFASYLSSIIERDVGDVSNVRTPEALERLLAVIAARTGGLVSYLGMGRDLGLDKNTVSAHARVLENLFLVRALKPWSVNLGGRQIKSPKLYVVDSGLLAFLLKASVPRIEAEAAVAGVVFESYAVMELLRLADLSDFEPSLYHFRDKEGREVDVVIEADSGDVVGVEVKSSVSVAGDAFAGLKRLRDKLGARFKFGAVLYAGERTLPFGDRLAAVPIAGLWSDQRQR
jgi:predicted AAA+ superfamily ATPase